MKFRIITKNIQSIQRQNFPKNGFFSSQRPPDNEGVNSLQNCKLRDLLPQGWSEHSVLHNEKPVFERNHPRLVEVKPGLYRYARLAYSDWFSAEFFPIRCKKPRSGRLSKKTQFEHFAKRKCFAYVICRPGFFWHRRASNFLKMIILLGLTNY